MLSPKQVKPDLAEGANGESQRLNPSLATIHKEATKSIDLRGHQLQLSELIQHEHLRVHLHDGSIFEGKLLDGLPHGDASWTQPQGLRIEGRWESGELHG